MRSASRAATNLAVSPEVAPHELVGLAGEVLGAFVERPVQALDLLAVEGHGALRLAVGTAQGDAPRRGAAALPFGGVHERRTAQRADVPSRGAAGSGGAGQDTATALEDEHVAFAAVGEDEALYVAVAHVQILVCRVGPAVGRRAGGLSVPLSAAATPGFTVEPDPVKP